MNSLPLSDNVALLIEFGADINRQSKFGGTPLIKAVTARLFEIALLLLRSGADPTIETSTGVSAIDFVVRYSDRGISRRADREAYREFVDELRSRGLLE